MRMGMLAGVALGTMLCAGAAQASAPSAGDVTKTYADIAHAAYSDALQEARELEEAVEAFIVAPDEERLDAARRAWREARVPYLQTEVYRFGNPIVDEWEGRVNAWPLDEGLIDYVEPAYGSESDQNEAYAANVIANETLHVGGREIDASSLDPAFLSETLHELGDVEANVATGYHAIEFLLWGQDLNGTGPGAGDRPFTDYAAGEPCTNGNCERRATYLRSVADLLVSDLEDMAELWNEGGEAREAVVADPQAGLRAIFTGMGSLSYGELAGERMKLGLMLRDPEEEQDCFSDNTHNSHYYDALGIRNVYLGRYETIDGRVVEGPSPADLVAAAAPDVDAELRGKLDATVDAMEAIRRRAESGEAYDQMIGEGNSEGNAAVQAGIDALVDQTRAIERAIAALDLGQLTLEGSDSLDAPNAVFR